MVGCHLHGRSLHGSGYPLDGRVMGSIVDLISLGSGSSPPPLQLSVVTTKMCPEIARRPLNCQNPPVWPATDPSAFIYMGMF